MRFRPLPLLTALLLFAVCTALGPVHAQSPTTFTYQGYLEESGGPAPGPVDLQLSLYDAESGGTQVGATVTKEDVPLTDGVFTVDLDFGAVFGAEARYLAVGVRDGGSTGSYTTLSPREALRPAPLATALPYLRVERVTNNSGQTATNVIGGDPSNSVASGVTGATISGGGLENEAIILSNEVSGSYGTVGGGLNNTASVFAAAGGGGDNTASGDYSSVGGGGDNTASGRSATIPGGLGNEASGDYSFAAGRRAKAQNEGAFVWADSEDADFASTDADQFLIQARGGVGIGTNSPSSPLTVAGAIESTSGGIVFPDGTTQTTAGVSSGNAWSLDGNAGTDPTAGDFLGTTDDTPLELRVNGRRVLRIEPAAAFDFAPNVIGGHPSNSVTSGEGATIGGGGYDNGLDVWPNIVDANYGTVGGGLENTASAENATIGGGVGNLASGLSATIGGGQQNTASGSRATVGGGAVNTASGLYATVPGGVFNDASGGYSFAAGRRAKAQNEGAFVWADSENADFASTGADQFLVRAAGGVGIGTNSPVTQFDVVRNVSGNADAGNHVARFENTAGDNGDVLVLKTGETSPSAEENYITFKDGATSGSNNVGAIQGNGSGGIEMISGGADFAEMLPRRDVAEVIAPGAIVGVSGGHVTRTTAAAERLMVVSDRALIVGNAPKTGADAYEKIAFVGQVPVRVEGAVSVGDFIVASGRHDGVGRAVAPEAWDPVRDGLIVGQAWEAQVGGTGRVLTAVGLDVTKPLVDRLAAQEARLDALERQLQSIQQQLPSSTPSNVDVH